MSDDTPPSDVYRDQFERFGKELLDRTNQPNVITFEQFRPYIPLFQKLQEEFAPRERPQTPYQVQMSRLYQQYIRNLGINLYEPTIVIQSREDPREVAWLDRIFTRIQPDAVPAHTKSARDLVPGGVSRVSSVSRDQQIMDASLVDIMNANNTPEQTEYFTKVKMGSSLVKTKFMENNMSPEQRALIHAEAAEISETGDESSSEAMYGVVDDDD